MSPKRNPRRLEQILPRHPRETSPARAAAPAHVATPVQAAAPAHVTVPVLMPQPEVVSAWSKGWQWLCAQGAARVLQTKTRRLRVSETVSLGEKRFVSLVEVDGASFLIGGSATGLSLLTELRKEPAPLNFHETLGKSWPTGETAA